MLFNNYIFLFLSIIVDLVLARASYNLQTLLKNESKSNEKISSSDISENIKYGALLALEHCQKVFKWDKWNCPKDQFYSDRIEPPNRETAFVQAILAAGVVHHVTKACSKGNINECSCKFQHSFDNQDENSSPTTENAKWSWGGCSDDPTFGYHVLKKLKIFDYPKQVEFSNVMDNNFNLGKEIIRQTMSKNCRCHGTSGSCSLQTCWVQQSSFEKVAAKLKEYYKKAKRVIPNLYESFSNSMKREERKFSSGANSLLYISESPDYCFENSTKGWPGTKGRACSKTTSENATLAEKKSCKNLCRRCGYKIRKSIKIVNKQCNCNFQWCCKVKCDMCEEVQEEYFCR